MYEWIRNVDTIYVHNTPLGCWRTLLLRCWSKASLVGRILSTSLVFCETRLILRKDINLFIWLIGIQPIDKFWHHFFHPWWCLEWSVVDGCKFLHEEWHYVHQLAAESLAHYLKIRCAVLSIECTEEIVFKDILLVVSAALKQIKISAATFTAFMWWK